MFQSTNYHFHYPVYCAAIQSKIEWTHNEAFCRHLLNISKIFTPYWRKVLLIPRNYKKFYKKLHKTIGHNNIFYQLLLFQIQWSKTYKYTEKYNNANITHKYTMNGLTGFNKIIPGKCRANRANFCLASKHSTTYELFHELVFLKFGTLWRCLNFYANLTPHISDSRGVQNFLQVSQRYPSLIIKEKLCCKETWQIWALERLAAWTRLEEPDCQLR